MSDFFNPVVAMPPFPSPIIPQPQFPYTTPIPQRPFGAFQSPMHVAYPSYSSTSTHPHPLVPPPPPGFEKPHVSDLVLTQPVPFAHKIPVNPIDEGFGISREDRLASVIALTLEPLTCPNTTIHLVVEENGKIQRFPLHRDLLCYYSPYFRRILGNKAVKAQVRKKNHSREWRWEDKESVEEIMEIDCSEDADKKVDVDVMIKFPEAVREVKLDTKELGDVGRAVVAAFVNWLYHGFSGFGLTRPLSPDVEQFDAATLIQLWVFAGRIGVPQCQNDCIEGIEWWRLTTNIIQTSMLCWVYENTQDFLYDDGDCPLRLLLIDQCAWKLDGNWLLNEMDGKKNENQFPRQALVDLVGRMRIILNELIFPPFLNSEMRRAEYWIDVDDKRVSEVLGEMY